MLQRPCLGGSFFSGSAMAKVSDGTLFSSIYDEVILRFASAIYQ